MSIRDGGKEGEMERGRRGERRKRRGGAAKLEARQRVAGISLSGARACRGSCVAEAGALGASPALPGVSLPPLWP